MNFYIHQSVFENDANSDNLDYLIRLVKENRHEWIFKNIRDLEAIKRSKWFEELGINPGSYMYSLIEKSYNSIIYEKKREDIKVINKWDPANPKEYELRDALIYLETIVLIIIENAHYDAYFLDALFKNFKGRSKRIVYAKRNEWLKYEGAGGKNNVLHIIRDAIKMYSGRLMPPENYIRMCVIIDSDKLYPKMPGPNENIVELCKSYNILCHVLYKRESENYLPGEILNYVDTCVSEVSDAYNRLNRDQKDFYDLEKGFGGALTQCSIEVQNLYEGLSSEDEHILRNGFDRINFKSKQELPKLFSHDNITQANLKSQCELQPKKMKIDRPEEIDDRNEIEIIIDSIDKMV